MKITNTKSKKPDKSQLPKSQIPNGCRVRFEYWRIWIWSLFVILDFGFVNSICQATTEAVESRLTIILPSEATIDGEMLTLGQIAEVTGDEALAAEARQVGLGRIAVAGQKITIDRTLILSRLMSSPDVINFNKPEFAGAEKVTVSRAANVVKGSKFVESASLFLATGAKNGSIAKWEVIRQPAEMVLPSDAKNIELSPRLVSQSNAGQATVEVRVISEGKIIGTRQVSFRPKYSVSRVITLTELSAGQTITAENTRLEKAVSDDPQPAGWTAPYGFAAVRNLPAGTLIGPGMAKAPVPEIKIERNQNVVIRIDRPGIVVTATGKAMQQGRAGEFIKVRNVDSQRVILAKVNEDGTVEPVF
jgi:flagella basal body P-ring formation protein FlgA